MQLEPRQLARDQRDLKVDLSLDEFPRLRELLADAQGPVVVRTHFRRDEQGRIRIEGRIEADVSLLCGNCRRTGPLHLDVPIDLCVVASEDEARMLIEVADPLILAATEVSPADLFEDDLILALPDRPCRGQVECPYRTDWAPEPPVDEPVEKNASPFAVLATLKGKDDKD